MKKQSRQVHLRVTGGMGITLEGAIDTATLPEDLARTVETELTPTRLSRVARRRAASFLPGQQEYEVTLLSGVRGSPKRYTFTDQQADPDLLDLMDELTSVIIRERMAARKAEQDEVVAAEPADADIQPPPAPQMWDDELGPDEETIAGGDDADIVADEPLAS